MTAVNIDEFDAVADSSRGFPTKMLGADGKTETGIVFFVLGKNSDPVTAWNRQLINGYIQKNEMAKRRGKPAEAKSAEQLLEDNINGAAVRVSGWEGVQQEFNQETLKRALRRNPHWVDQVVETSDDLGNYLAKPSKT